MTVSELIELLEGVPQAVEVFCSLDDAENGLAPTRIPVQDVVVWGDGSGGVSHVCIAVSYRRGD